jgi:hypothetical protein
MPDAAVKLEVDPDCFIEVTVEDSTVILKVCGFPSF